MASRSRKSGGRSFLPQILSTIVVGIFIIGFLGLPARPDAASVWEQLKSKSENLGAYLSDCIPGLVELDLSGCGFDNFATGGNNNNNGGGGGTGGGQHDVSALEAKLNTITTPTQIFFDYDRSEWTHWQSAGSSCWNVREEVLFLQAESIILLDKDSNVTENKGNACSIQSGVWVDPYSGATFTDPSKLDIDHVIPLSYANEVGGEPWAKRLKTQFANDIERNLLAVSASENRAKGSKGPGSWLPTDSAEHCLYAEKWIETAVEYNLPLKSEDITTLKSIVASC